MISTLDAATWPQTQLGDAVASLARRAGFALRNASAPSVAVFEGGVESLGRSIDATADWLGIESEPVATTYAEVTSALEACGPAIWAVPLVDGGPGRCLAVVDGGGGALRLLLPDGGMMRLPTDVVRRAIVGPLEAKASGGIEAILAAAGTVSRRRAQTREALLSECHGHVPIEGCWLLRPHPGSSFWQQARQVRCHRLALRMILAHAAQYVFMLAAWWTLGRGALDGHFDPGWLVAWAILLVSAIPFQLVASWSESVLSLLVARLMKQRLLFGTFHLKPEVVRSEGSGELLGRVIESEAVESLMTTGGFAALMALVEIAIVAGLLGQGPGGAFHVALFLGWTAVACAAAYRFYVRRRAWTTERLGLTRDLVERMVGHRTRLAQQAPERWHEGEDLSVDRYLQASRGADRAAVTMSTLMGRGWIVVGLAGLIPALLHNEMHPASLALGLGAIILADQALQKLTSGVIALGDAAIAWRVVRPLFMAAADVEFPVVPGVAAEESEPRALQAIPAPIVEAHGLTFRHAGRVQSVLRDCSFAIHGRDRILLEGPSGGGKSTLATVLTGFRSAESGLLLLRGLDRVTMGGTAWRRRIVAVPQFHENHILTGSFAFNVLMGRSWPAGPAELEEAAEVCRELGLGPLLERMPGGLQQTIGESGWQLSHGERSRLYIARSLMQKADLVVLDESFAALDPENLDLAIRCVLNRTDALLVIAHP